MIHQRKTYRRVLAGRRPVALVALLAGFCLLSGLLAGPVRAGAVQEANAGREGQTLDLQTLPVKGKTTVVDFYSPFCPPCMKLAPLLEQLAQQRSDLVIKKVNIQRPQVQGNIDWQSPLAKQLGLHSIPHLVIFDKQGQTTATGQEAIKQVVAWLQEAGLLKQ